MVVRLFNLHWLFFFLDVVLFQHIVVEVELGEKTIERSKSSRTEFTKYAMNNVSMNPPFKLIE